MPQNLAIADEDNGLVCEISVFAAGKSESAFVWWVLNKPIEDELDVTGWEVYRYRQYPGNDGVDDWLYKGKVHISGRTHRSCTVINLHDSCMYRFSVRCLYTKKPPSVESPPSPPTVVDTPLPTGYLRMFDKSKGAFYYVNVRTRESSWHRPEKNKMFLEESVAIYFTDIEMLNLRHIYEEEQKRFGNISVVRFRECCVQVGESDVTDMQLVRLFKNFTRNKTESEKTMALSNWIHFMDIMRCLKKLRMKLNNSFIRYLQLLFEPKSEINMRNSKIDKKQKRRRRVFWPKENGDW